MVLGTHQTGDSGQSIPRTVGNTVNSTDLIEALFKMRVRSLLLDNLQSMSLHMSDTHMSERLAELAISVLSKTDSFSVAMESLWDINLINTSSTKKEFFIRHNITDYGLCTYMSLASVIGCLCKMPWQSNT